MDEMTKDEISREVNKMIVPELFGCGKDELIEKYDQVLDSIGPKTNEEIGFLLEAMNKRYEETLEILSERAINDYASGEISDLKNVPLLLVEHDGEKHVENIPYIVADWIGIIGYAMKKYDV